jgi:hypothetical protein
MRFHPLVLSMIYLFDKEIWQVYQQLFMFYLHENTLSEAIRILYFLIQHHQLYEYELFIWK